MNRLSIGIASGLTLALVIAASPAHASGAGSGSTPNLRVTYSVSNVQFDGSECSRVPVTIDYVKEGAAYDDISGEVNLDIRYQGSSSSNSASAYIGYFEPQTGRKETSFLFCPFESAPDRGNLQVTGTVKSNVFRAPEAQSTLAPSSIAVILNKTTMSRVKVKKQRGYYNFSGTVTAQTLTQGAIGARGTITIQLKKRGSSRWVSGTTTSPDSFGAWSTGSYSVSTRTYPKGTQFRVVFSGCDWCTGAEQTGKLP